MMSFSELHSKKYVVTNYLPLYMSTHKNLPFLAWYRQPWKTSDVTPLAVALRRLWLSDLLKKKLWAKLTSRVRSSPGGIRDFIIFPFQLLSYSLISISLLSKLWKRTVKTLFSPLLQESVIRITFDYFTRA